MATLHRGIAWHTVRRHGVGSDMIFESNKWGIPPCAGHLGRMMRGPVPGAMGMPTASCVMSWASV